MLETRLTAEKRTALWARAAKLFPDLAAKILEKFDTLDRDENPKGYHHMVGVSFMFLAMVNSLHEDPVIDWEEDFSPKAVRHKAVPAFGYLKPFHF